MTKIIFPDTELGRIRVSNRVFSRLLYVFLWVFLVNDAESDDIKHILGMYYCVGRVRTSGDRSKCGGYATD